MDTAANLFPQFGPLLYMLGARWDEHKKNPEGGFDLPATIIITAIVAALALAVGAIIVTKVTDKANSIPMN